MAEKQAQEMNSIGIHNGVKVVKVPIVLTEFVDKDGSRQTRLAVIIDKEVRFFVDGVLSAPAQQWLSSDILKASGVI